MSKKHLSQTQQELDFQHGSDGFAVLDLAAKTPLHQLLKGDAPDGQELVLVGVGVAKAQVPGQVQVQHLVILLSIMPDFRGSLDLLRHTRH